MTLQFKARNHDGTTIYGFPIAKFILTWFNSLKDKYLIKFVMFDMKDIYPSITQYLLKKTLNFVNEYINILKFDIDVVHCTRESLLFKATITELRRKKVWLMC